jgi:sulfate permease, SulP family
MESVSVAKYIAARNGYQIRPNRELVGLGAANLTAALFSGYPVTGGFSRTAVNYQAGARTRLASVITAAIIILTLVLLTPLFYYLPNAVLGAIVLVAVAGLVDYREAVRLFRLKPADGWTFLLTFIATLALGVETGILSGVALSLGLFIWRSAHPHTAELGYLREEGVFRNVQRYPRSERLAGVLILRVDASLYFANAKFLHDWFDRSIATRKDVRWVIVDMSGVNDIDALGIGVLEDMADSYGPRGVRFAFAAMKGPVRDLAERAGWSGRYGPHCAYPSVGRALQGIGVWDRTSQA